MEQYRNIYREMQKEMEELNNQHDTLHEKIGENEERQEILSKLMKPFTEIFGPKEEAEHKSVRRTMP